jgi:hypothetical protein
MEYIDILCETATEYLGYAITLPYLSKTKLIKLTYLVEYFFYKRYQNRITNADWVFFLFGPYLYNFDESLKHSPFSVEVAEDSEEYKIIVKDEDYFRRERITDYDAKQIIKKVVSEYGRMDLGELLDFIYFETEPMLNVNTRRDRLDFSCIKKEEMAVTQRLGKDEIISIIKKHKQRFENARII